MAGPGLLDLFFKDLRWKLESADGDGFSLDGQFTTTDLVEDISANYSEFRTLGRAQPILMFNDNANDRMSFTARFWAQHNGLLGLFADKVDDKVEALRGLAKPVSHLGRPRIFDFSVGEFISMRCVVETVGGIAYDRLRPATGDLRGVTASIVLRRFEEYSVELSGAAAESLVQPFLLNDSYEHLAQRTFGAPILGEALRRRNPNIPKPSVGTFIHIPPRATLTRGFALTPQAPTLAVNDANDERKRTFFKARKDKRTISYKLGPAWDKAA